MAKKLRVGILFGGRSGEHEVSLLSAASILKAIDRKKFEVVPIGITKTGRWLTDNNAKALLEGAALEALPESAALPSDAVTAMVPDAASLSSAGGSGRLDLVFPVLHGTFGEDGTIQGLFELADIPYVGSGVLGSSAGMDKDVMKRLFSAARLPIVKHVSVLRSEWEKSPRKVVARIESALKYPLFVKPANLGSSVGISKAHDRTELGPALSLASRFDRKLVIEQGVGGAKKKARELEVAVLGNDDPKASVVGESPHRSAPWLWRLSAPVICLAWPASIFSWSQTASAASTSTKSIRFLALHLSACTPNSGRRQASAIQT